MAADAASKSSKSDRIKDPGAFRFLKATSALFLKS
jgi:hypothetical protein